MRLIIRHETVYRFESPASAVIQTLRLTPRSFEGQHVVRWRLDVDRNCRLRQHEDAFGNHTHVFAADGPIDGLTVMVEGEIDTQECGGVIRSAIERFPPALYLRETDLTTPDAELAAFADEVAARPADGALATLHALMAAIHERMTFDASPTDSATTAAEAFQMRRGVCQDLTHIFLAAARRMRVPARYVSGYFRRIDGVTRQEAGHAWAEAYVPDLGWVGFDPTNGICVTEAHVRVAIGLDYLNAAPVRGTRYGGAGESLEVSVLVEDARAKRAFRRA
jgi:transglutaminase-like putative cysteine protease